MISIAPKYSVLKIFLGSRSVPTVDCLFCRINSSRNGIKASEKVMGYKAVCFYNNNIRMFSVLEPSGFIIFVPIIEYNFYSLR